MRASSSAMARWQPCGHSAGVPMCQFAETSSGGVLQYGIGMRQWRHARGLDLRNSTSRMV